MGVLWEWTRTLLVISWPLLWRWGAWYVSGSWVEWSRNQGVFTAASNMSLMLDGTFNALYEPLMKKGWSVDCIVLVVLIWLTMPFKLLHTWFGWIKFNCLWASAVQLQSYCHWEAKRIGLHPRLLVLSGSGLQFVAVTRVPYHWTSPNTGGRFRTISSKK